MSGVTVASVEEQIAEGRSLVPDHLWRGIRDHIICGTPSGNFLSSVFANDLLNAATGADEISLANLPDIMRFRYNYAPSYCWGTRACVEMWRRHGGVEGAAFEHDDVIEAYEMKVGA